jgi:polyisoprenoid-binding protein YceI
MTVVPVSGAAARISPATHWRHALHLVGASLLLICLAFPATAVGQTVTWTIDPGHSAAQFAVRHMLVATVHGEFNGPTGIVSFDPAKVADTLTVSATIDARTISTRNDQRDRDLKSATFFDVAKYPTITFKSKRATAGTAGHIMVIGDLTIHGVTREVTLDAEPPTPAVKDLDGLTRIGSSATTTINRWDFGLRYNELIETGGAVVADQVRISLDLEMTHK